MPQFHQEESFYVSNKNNMPFVRELNFLFELINRFIDKLKLGGQERCVICKRTEFLI